MKFSYILHSIKQVFITFITLFSLLFSPQIKCENGYNATHPDKLIMSFSIVSDIHVENTNPDAYSAFVDLLKGIKGGKNIDAAVYLGDNVMNGQFFENLLFYSAVKKVKPANTNLVALGNHDVGNGDGNYEGLCKSFLNFNSLYLKNPIDKPYYYTLINGCYMVFLASEDSSSNESIISDEQITWLNKIINEAAENNSPVLLFNHHPIFLVARDSRDAIINMVSSYGNLIYFCGHTHMELCEYSFEEDYGINTIYLPRSVDADGQSGVGIVVEVYENQILIKPRNFISGEWITELERSYPLIHS